PGRRDADNLAWKLAHVLTGRAGPDLLDSYETERRPHARALIKKAVRVGWAMTGGQDPGAPGPRGPPGAAGPQRPHLPGHGLHRHPAPGGRRPAAIAAALPPVRHSPRAAGRRPDPAPAGVRRGRPAGR